MDILKNRPFELCSISGFGFKTVDEIARETLSYGCFGAKKPINHSFLRQNSNDSEYPLKTSYTPNDPMRIGGALQFVLDEEMTAGHLYLAKEQLREKAHELLNHGYENEVVTLAEIHKTLCSLVKEGTLVHEDGCIYLHRNFLNEEETAEAIVRYHMGKPIPVDVTDALAASQKKLGLMLSPKQKEAVEMCLNNSISIITGGPGTGKTTVLRVILDVYKTMHENREITLCAPTGRAARRMEESTGHPAYTLHKTFGLLTEEDDCNLNESYDISADFVIVDEFSMVDMALAKELFTRVKCGAQILLVGDADQLPSVGAGNVFRELMNGGCIPVTRLDLVYRQSGTSRIAINADMMQEDNSNLHYGEDFQLFPCTSSAQTAAVVCQN